MAIADHVLRLIHFNRVSGRNHPMGSLGDSRQTQSLRQRLRERGRLLVSNALFRRGIGFAFVLFGIALALAAHQASQTLGIQNWLRQNPPTRTLAHALLRAQGFTSARFGDDARGRVARGTLKKLPEVSDSAMRTWMSDDANWTVLTWPPRAGGPETSDTGEPLELWCRDCSRAGAGFQSAGTSWTGLDYWARALKKAPQPERNKPEKKLEHAPGWVHPKEVRVWR